MKVAIIGAGLAGLSCARELDRRGITAHVFEKKNHAGAIVTYGTATLKLFDSTLKDSLKYMKNNYHLTLTPLFPLEEICMISPSREASVNGDLGYIFLRGIEACSLEGQLACGVNQTIFFDSDVVLQDLAEEYDYVVVASGDCSIAKAMDLWTTSLNARVRMATVVGNFNTGRITMWVNTEFSNHCYCYLLPHSTREATLVLTAENASASDVEYYWKTFLIIEEITYPITQILDFEYTLGYVDSLQTGNIYFAGSAAGLTDDFLGFGVFNAVESGILAAKSIAENKKYMNLVHPLQESVKKYHKFRTTINSYDNEDYDRLLAFLDLPGIKQFIYDNPVIRAKHYTSLLKTYNKLKQT